MTIQEIEVGKRVVRSKGDYVVGRLGTIVGIAEGRARVSWEGETTTWVKADVIEDAAKPYGFTEFKHDRRTGKRSYPKYYRL